MSNPLIQDLQDSGTIETVSIALPTLGRFYEDGVIDSDAKPDDLEVRAIGIMAELSTRDPFILASGKGMELLIPQICPSIKEPGKLAEIDLEAILLAARIATHGNQMVVEHTCTNMVQTTDDEETLCGEQNKIDVNLYDIITRYGPIEFSDKFVVDLPEYKQKVFLRPMEYEHALSMLRDTLNTRKEATSFNTKQDVTELLTDANKIDEYASIVMKQAITTMESVIYSIFYVEAGDGKKVFDHDQIKEWLMAISNPNVKKIIKHGSELNKSFYGKNEVVYKCSACGADNKTTIELDVQKLFFFIPQNSEAPRKSTNTSRKRKNPKQTR